MGKLVGGFERRSTDDISPDSLMPCRTAAFTTRYKTAKETAMPPICIAAMIGSMTPKVPIGVADVN